MKGFRITYILLLIFVLISFTSCYEFIEEVRMNADGSGDLKLVLNLSQSKDRVKSILQMDSIHHVAVPKQATIENKIKEIKNIASTVEGVANVVAINDFENFIFTFKFHFNNTRSLDLLLDTLRTTQKISKYIKADKEHISINEQNDFIFNGLLFDLDLLKKLPNTIEKDLLETSTITIINRFEKMINATNGSHVKISPSKKATMVKCKSKEIVEKPTILNYQIKFL